MSFDAASYIKDAVDRLERETVELRWELMRVRWQRDNAIQAFHHADAELAESIIADSDNEIIGDKAFTTLNEMRAQIEKAKTNE